MNQRCNTPITNHTEKAIWEVITGSVTGADHHDKGLPNQDAASWRHGQLPNHLVVAVADGHGAPKCFRSQIGARLATQVGIEAGLKFLSSLASHPDYKFTRKAAQKALPNALAFKWRKMVEEHHQQHPFQPNEKMRLCRQRGLKDFREISDWPALAYGSTLLLLLLAHKLRIMIQLGDGDILEVWDKGKVKRVFDPKPGAIGGATDSLCAVDAATKFRVVVRFDEHPDLIMLSTDGYSNSYGADESFFQVARDYMGIIRQEGPRYVKENLKTWLQEDSEKGSGDDTTVAVVYRSED